MKIKLFVINFFLCINSIALFSQPINDKCDNADQLNSGTSCSTKSGTVLGATSSSFAAAYCGQSVFSPKDVFYKFTAQSSSQTITATPNVIGGTLDIVLELYDFSRNSCTLLDFVDCNDATGVGVINSWTKSGLTPNKEYRIRLYHYSVNQPNTANSGFTICVTHTPQITCNNWNTLPTSSPTFPSNGGNGLFDIIASNSGCSSIVVNNSPNIISTISAQNGTVNYTVSQNNTTSPRTGTISIKDANQVVQKTFTVYQDGQVTPQYGSVKVTITPIGAVNATPNAQWNIDNGTWNNSDLTLQNISVGAHKIYFKAISGWTEPPVKDIQVFTNTPTTTPGNYTQIITPQYGSVNVTITPQEAITANALWNIDGGAWQSSGVTLSNIAVGNHDINFKAITGWTTPNSEPIAISANNTLKRTGIYQKVNTPQYKISGKINNIYFDLNTGNFVTLLLSGATIKLYKTGSTILIQTVQSLTDGSFVLPSLQADNYDIVAENDGYSIKIRNINSNTSIIHNIKIPQSLISQIATRANRISKISLHSNSITTNGHNTTSLNALLNSWKSITLDNENDESYYEALARLQIITYALEIYNNKQVSMGEILDDQLVETAMYFIDLLANSIKIEKILNKCSFDVCKKLGDELLSIKIQISFLYGAILQRIIRDNSKIKPLIPYMEGVFGAAYEYFEPVNKIGDYLKLKEIFIEKPIQSLAGPMYIKNMYVAPLESQLEASVSQQKTRSNQSNLYNTWNISKRKTDNDNNNHDNEYIKIVKFFAFAEHTNDSKKMFEVAEAFQEGSGFEWMLKVIPVFKTVISGVKTGINLMSGFADGAGSVLLFNNGNNITSNAKANLSAILVPRNFDKKEFNTEAASLLIGEVQTAVNEYNNKLKEIKIDINSKRFSSSANKLNSLNSLDSLLTFAIIESLKTIDASYSLAPVNENDTLYHRNLYNSIHASPNNRLAVRYQLINTIIDSNNISSIDSLNVFVDKTIKSNIEVPNEIQLLNDLLIGIPSNPYIAIKSFQIKRAYSLSSTNTVLLRYKNYGNTVAKNVYAKIGMDNFVTISKDSFYLGQILPNSEGALEFTFKVPSFDTIGKYTIHFGGDDIVGEGKGGAFRVGIKNYTTNIQVFPVTGGITTGTTINEVGTRVIVKATPNKCYKFINWTENGIEVSKDSVFSFTATTLRNLVANFQELPKYKIEATANPSQAGKITGLGTYCENEEVALKAVVTNSDYRFVNWTELSVTPNLSDSTLTFRISKSRALIANFELRKIVITASTPSGGTILGGGTYTIGDNVKLIARADKCAVFLNWTENGTAISTDSIITFSAKNVRNVVANFKEFPKYNIDAKPNPLEGGAVSGGGILCEGEKTILKAVAKPEYLFLGWFDKNLGVTVGSSSPELQITATAARSITADFIKRSTPKVNFLPKTTIGCAPIVIEFTDSSTCGTGNSVVARSWNFYGTGVNPSTSTAQNPKVQYTQKGIYAVRLIITCNDARQDTLIKDNLIKIDCATGTHEIESIGSLQLNPNPNEGIFNLDFQLNKPALTSVKVYNIIGQLIYTKPLGNQVGSFRETIDLSNVAKGNYVVEIQIGEQSLIEKIVIR